jgi:hypothetical protein
MRNFTPTTEPGDPSDERHTQWPRECRRAQGKGNLYNFFEAGTLAQEFQNIGYTNPHATNTGAGTALRVIDNDTAEASRMHVVSSLFYLLTRTHGRLGSRLVRTDLCSFRVARHLGAMRKQRCIGVLKLGRPTFRKPCCRSLTREHWAPCSASSVFCRSPLPARPPTWYMLRN